MFITHCLQLNLQLHEIDMVRTCRTSSFYTVAWQLARFQLTRHIALSLGDSRASCMSAETLMKRGGKLEHISVAYFLWNISAKIIKPNDAYSSYSYIVGDHFYDTRCTIKRGEVRHFRVLSVDICPHTLRCLTSFLQLFRNQIPYLENIAYKCLHRQTNHAVASAVCRNSPHLSLLVVQRCGLIIVINYSVIIEKYFLISR